MYMMVERKRRIELPLERDQSGTKNTQYNNIKNFMINVQDLYT